MTTDIRHSRLSTSTYRPTSTYPLTSTYRPNIDISTSAAAHPNIDIVRLARWHLQWHSTLLPWVVHLGTIGLPMLIAIVLMLWNQFQPHYQLYHYKARQGCELCILISDSNSRQACMGTEMWQSCMTWICIFVFCLHFFVFDLSHMLHLFVELLCLLVWSIFLCVLIHKIHKTIVYQSDWFGLLPKVKPTHSFMQTSFMNFPKKVSCRHELILHTLQNTNTF